MNGHLSLGKKIYTTEDADGVAPPSSTYYSRNTHMPEKKSRNENKVSEGSSTDKKRRMGTTCKAAEHVFVLYFLPQTFSSRQANPDIQPR